MVVHQIPHCAVEIPSGLRTSRLGFPDLTTNPLVADYLVSKSATIIEMLDQQKGVCEPQFGFEEMIT